MMGKELSGKLSCMLTGLAIRKIWQLQYEMVTSSIKLFKKIKKNKKKHQGPVVQRIVSLTNSSRGQLIKYFTTL